MLVSNILVDRDEFSLELQRLKILYRKNTEDICKEIWIVRKTLYNIINSGSMCMYTYNKLMDFWFRIKVKIDKSKVSSKKSVKKTWNQKKNSYNGSTIN